MICPTCKLPKTEKDFYYDKRTGSKSYKDCRDCVSKAREAKKKEKEDYAKNFFIN